MYSVCIVGCGYSGRRLAERLRNVGATVRGYATRAESLRQIAATGAEALPLDLDGEIAPVDFTGQLIYYCVPPACQVGDPRLDRFLNSVLGAPKRVIYLSTTGIYGDHAGARVDEDTPPAPQTERAARRLAAETALRSWAGSRGVSWCVLRVAGIYGPGRLPLARLRRADPAIIPQEATPSNRIHVDDLVTACVAAGLVETANGRIYNISDGSEDSFTAYLQRVAAITHLPSPPLLRRAAAERYSSTSLRPIDAGSRRVDNRRMLAELGVKLEYHDLDCGIRSSLDAD